MPRPAATAHRATDHRSALILLDIDGTLLHADGAGRAAMESSLRLVFGEVGARADIDSHSFGGKPDSQTLRELLLPLGVTSDTIDAHLPEFTATLAREMARGMGLLAGIDVVVNKESRAEDAAMAAVIGDLALAMGVRTRPLGGTIAFSPPLCITADEVDLVINTMGDAITRAAG